MHLKRQSVREGPFHLLASSHMSTTTGTGPGQSRELHWALPCACGAAQGLRQYCCPLWGREQGSQQLKASCFWRNVASWRARQVAPQSRDAAWGGAGSSLKCSPRPAAQPFAAEREGTSWSPGSLNPPPTHTHFPKPGPAVRPGVCLCVCMCVCVEGGSLREDHELVPFACITGCGGGSRELPSGYPV